MKLHAHELGDTRLLHGHSVHCLSRFHGLLGMRNQDELRLERHLFQQARQALDVRLVKRRIHFVENTERAGLLAEYRHEQRQRGLSLLAAGKEQYVLQFLTGRRSDNIDAGIGFIHLIGEPHLADATAEERLE